MSGVNTVASTFVPDLFAPSFFAACFIRPQCVATAGLTANGRLYFWYTDDGKLVILFFIIVMPFFIYAQ